MEDDTSSLQADLAKLTNEKDKLAQGNMTLSTKVEFLSLELSQKDYLVTSMES